MPSRITQLIGEIVFRIQLVRHFLQQIIRIYNQDGALGLMWLAARIFVAIQHIHGSTTHSPQKGSSP